MSSGVTAVSIRKLIKMLKPETHGLHVAAFFGRRHGSGIRERVLALTHDQDIYGIFTFVICVHQKQASW